VKTYENRPEDAWERIKVRTDKPKVLAVLREIAAWREREAQGRDVPRNRIVKDEVLADMAIHPPETAEELGKIRGLSADFARGKMGKGMLEAVMKGLATPPKDCPRLETPSEIPVGTDADAGNDEDAAADPVRGAWRCAEAGRERRRSGSNDPESGRGLACFHRLA
jgi:ribonuclease D